jgi:predicted permease
MFAAAVGLFLLIGAADVLLLFFLRALRLADDERIRWALGARAGDRLTRSAMEGAVVGVGALLVTAASGTVFLRVLLSLAPPEIPRLDLVRLDLASLGAGAVAALATTLVAALTAAYVARPRGARQVAAGRHSGGPWTQRVRAGLVSLESALSLVLVAAALILGRSFQAYGDWSPGFPVEGLASAQLFASTAEVTDAAAAADAWRRVEEHARAIPGVRAASTVSAGPLFGGSETATYTTDAGEAGPRPVARWYDASPGYFATLGRTLVAGRSLDERDTRGAEQVAVLNETMARRAFPGLDPIGRVVRFPETDLSFRVVGVVADVPPLVPGEPSESEIFWSNRQLPRWGAFLVTRLEPGTAIPDVEAGLAALEPTISVGSLRPLLERWDAALVRPRFLVFLIGVFAALAALLAAGGLFAVLSVSVSERMREMGIRVALGAPRGLVLWRTLRGGIVLAGGGALVGAVLIVSAEAALVRAVPGLAPAGLLLLGASIALMLSAAVAAALPAAIRASRADPVDLLRDPG